MVCILKMHLKICSPWLEMSTQQYDHMLNTVTAHGHIYYNMRWLKRTTKAWPERRLAQCLVYRTFYMTDATDQGSEE